MKLHPEIRIALGLILSFILVAGGGVITYFNSTRAIESGKTVYGGLEFLATLESLFEVLLSVDRLSIDYAEHGDDAKLQKFQAALSMARAHVEFIKAHAAHDEHRYKQIVEVESRVDALLTHASDLVSLKSQRGAAAASESFRDEQQSLLDYIRGRILYMESEERVLIAKNNHIYAEQTARLYQAYALLGLTTVVFFFALLFTLIKYVRGERRIAEAERRVAHEIVAHAPIGVLLLDGALNVISSNPAICSYLNCEEAQGAMKERVDEVLSKLPAATKEAIAGLRSGRMSESEMNDLQLKEIMLIPDRYWDMAIWPIIDDQKQLKGLIFLVVDVTDRLKLYRQRQLLFNTFTHDLKNPIIGNQYLIKALLTDSRYNLEDSIKSVIDELDAGNQDVLRMIMNILEIAKLQNDEAMPAQRFESFDLRELLAQCANETARLGKSKNIQLTRQFPDQEQNIYSDKVALKHLVLNLLENAIKFSDENAQVAITISKDKPEAISFSVYNEGESLSEQEKQNLFKTIGQGELGRRYPGGSGIGLYLCSQLIQALGGDLQCTAGGEGTTFTATIPIVPAPPEARNDSAKEGSDRQSPSLEIVDHGASDRLSKDEANQTPDNGGVAGEAQVEATGEDCHGRHEESGRPGSLSKTRTKQKRRKAQ